MFKKMVFVAASMFMAANSVLAGDDLASMVANFEGAKDKVAQVDSVADQLGQKDVDALMGETKEDGQDAIAACFRRNGYGGGHGSYGYNYNCYNSYNCYSYCQPSYSSYSSCYYPSYCYTPVTYSCYTPVSYSCYSPCYTSYWGCW